MAQPLDSTKLGKSFFHAFSKTQTESTQYVFESLYKSAHSTRGIDVWSDTVPYAINATAADNNVSLHPTILKKYTLASLTEIPGSNGQAWYLNDGGKFVRPWVSPTDIPDPLTNDPSYGYQTRLYKSDNSQIMPTSGVWMIDYYAGLILFEPGSTPAALGYGIPKVTCYSYIGKSITSTGTAGYLYQLGDVLISSTGTTDGFVLTYNTISGKWIATSTGTASTISPWATSTVYDIGDYVYLLTSTGSTLYRCMFAHTSSTSFYLDNTYWELISSSIKQWEPQGVFKKNDLIYDANLVYIALSDFVSSPISIIDDRNSGYLYRIDGVEQWGANTQYHIGNQVIAPNNRLYRAFDDHLSTANFNDDMYYGGHWVTEGVQIADWTTNTSYEYRDMVYYTGAAYISNWGQISRPLRFERDLDDGDWTPITPLVDFFTPDQIIATSMLVKNVDNRIAKATLNFRTVGTFDDHLSSGDLVLLLDPELIRIFAFVADAELAIGKHNGIMYCDETGSWYQYTSTGGTYTQDSLYILDTGDGGDTRWLAVAGKYTYNEINSTQTLNLKEQTSTPSPLTGYIKAFAYQSQGNDIFTRLLLHFNNGNGSTVFDDSSPYNEVVTDYNGTIQSDTIKKFGISSGFFNGINQYLSIPQLNFNFLTDNFSIDSWVYLLESREHILYSHGDDSDNFIKLYMTSTGGISLRIVSGGTLSINITGGNIPLLSFHHVAAQRDGNNWYLFIDGTRVSLGVSSVSLNFSSDPQIGSNSTAPSPNEIFTNIYGYWKLDENIGTAINDSSGNSRNGTLNVGAWVVGKLGSALQFTGIATNYVDFGNIANFENNISWTIGCWFNLTATAVNTFISKRTSAGSTPGYRIAMTAAGAVVVELRNADANRIMVTTTASGFDDGVWRYLVVTYDGSRNAFGVRIYVNAVSQSYTVNNNTLTASILNAAPFNISGYNNGAAQRLNGRIDECAVWENRVLTQSDVTYLYNSNAGRYIDELITDYLKAYIDEYRICKGTIRYPYSTFGLPEVPYGMTSPYWVLPDGSIVGLTDLGFIGTKQWGEDGSNIFREDGRVDVYKDFGSGRDYVRVKNVTGSQLTQYKIVRVYGYDALNDIPHISSISSFTQTPIGLLPQNISDGDIDFILKRGVITVSGFDTTGSSFVDPVYSTSTGDLTLNETPLRVGKVVSLNANGSIYVNIGGERSNLLSADTDSIELKTSSGIFTAIIKDEGVKEPHLDSVNLPSDDDVLKWDTSTGRFIWGPIPQSLAGLDDVNIPAPVDGQALVYNTSTGKWIATSTGSTGLSIYYNGTLLDAYITELNFEGVGLSVEDTIVGQRATVYVPPAAYSPYYNVGGASVPSIVTTLRYVAAPTSEGVPYKIGGWAGGTQHACVNTGAWNYTAAGACSFKTLTTTIEAIVYDADGTTPLATHTTAAITGNIDVTVNNIRIRVTGFIPEVSRYKGTIIVDYTISSILAPGGRCSIQITHHNAGTDYTKTQNDIFYDINNNAATLAGGTTTIAETGGGVVTRFISGVEYYYLGSQFSLAVSDIDYINCNSYPTIVLDCDGSEYGLPTLNLGTGSLTGWTNVWDDINDSYSNIAWAITAANFFSLSTTANVSSRVEDWAAGAWQNSANASIAIETHNTTSTDTIERFYYENYRCASGSNFDLPAQKAWTSSNDVAAGDAIFYNGGVERIGTLANGGNFTIYNPNAGTQPNYSASQNATVYLWREFITDGLAHANARINITGTYTSLECKMAKAWDGLATGGSVFMNCLAAYNGGQFNFGNPTGGTGCQTGTGAGYIDITFGSQNTLNTSNTVYLKIGLTGANRVTALNMVFS